MLDEDDAGKAARDEIAARLSRFCFVKTFVFREADMQPEDLSLTRWNKFGEARHEHQR